MRQAAQASPHPSVPVVDVGEQGCEQGKTKEDDDYKSSQSGGGTKNKTKPNQKSSMTLCLIRPVSLVPSSVGGTLKHLQ